ncbi:MAG: hypothetical protein OEY56_00835 [Cyclobacteriaceae bacterium]|nr:hypothetical protein [Cyclobacteriaceae bacterium]
MRSVSLIIASLLFFSCQSNDCRPTPDAGITITPWPINRLDQSLFSTKNVDEVMSFLIENPTMSEQVYFIDEYPDASILAANIHEIIHDPYIDTLYRESVEAFEKNERLFSQELGTAMAWLHYYFPQSPLPEVKTMITGLYQDLIVSEKEIIIGIDYFIGENATYSPSNVPNYIKKRYSYEYLAPTVLKFYISSFAENGAENTLLSEMIDFGKVYYFLSQLLPCTEDYRIIGFGEQEMLDVNANQEIIWANFIQNEWLYETSEITKMKFLGERPNIYEIGEKCPGRIGAWLGWKIVESYMQKSGSSLQELLRETDHHKIFSESGYKPKNKK